MREHDVMMYIMANKNYLPEQYLPYLRDRMLQMTEEQMTNLSMVSFQNPTIILLISIFLGELGIDRFMLGDTGLGIGKLLTGGGCGIWWFIDLFYVVNRTKQKNWQKLMLYL